MFKLFFSSFLLLASYSLCLANGVGAPLKEVKEGHFASFFNITEQSSKKLVLGQKEAHYKTGGFKEYIDLYLTTAPDQTLQRARILVKYPFISEQSRFAIDVIKSFIGDFCHEKDKAACHTLEMRLWNGEGEIAPELAPIMSVLSGQKKRATVTLNGCVLTVEAKKEGLEIVYHFISWEKQPLAEALFLTEKDLASYSFQNIQTEPDFKVWTTEDNEAEKLAFSRLVDGRWQFKTPREAANYFSAYQLFQSEGMEMVESEAALTSDEAMVYQSGAEQRKMMATLGITDPPTGYIFMLRKGKTIAKLFVMTTPTGSFEEAFKIAQQVLDKL